MLRNAPYSRFHIAVGGQDKLADNTVAPLGSGRIDGDGIVALLSNIELEGLLSRTAEVVGCHITDVDVWLIGLTRYAGVACPVLNI